MTRPTIELILFDLDDCLFDTTGQLKPDPTRLDLITPFPETVRMLSDISCRKVLVTKGKSERQNTKIDNLKIRTFFQGIYICDAPEGKYESFVEAMKEFSVLPEQVLVVGNRIDEEIMYGNQLGCRTVRLIHGKYASQEPQHPHQIPQFSITNIGELKSIMLGL